MPTVVVDASAIAAILFGEPAGDEMQVAVRGQNLIAPRLLRFEIVNIALKKRRLQPASVDAIILALSSYTALAIREVDIAMVDVFATAAQSGLSAYDASYLWLARREGTKLITLDAELAAASR